MKLQILLIASAIALATASIKDLDEKWEEFKVNFNKVYRLSNEEQVRKEIFSKNLMEIEEHNERYATGKESYEKGINQFSDLTYEEFARVYLGENDR